MANHEFNAASFWDWAAYDLNWINIAAQERWLNGKGCPLDCNETGIDRLRDGLQVYLNANQPQNGLKLFDMLKVLDKYRGNHAIGFDEYTDDMGVVCGLIKEIMNDVPELKSRILTLNDWVDNGHARNIAFQTGGNAPAPVLMPPTMR